MTATQETTLQTIDIRKEINVNASLEITFESVLAELGPEGEMPDGKPFPMRVEPWPGGRWYRDLGDNAGHLWGHIQVIKPPTLIEISGPLFMSYPATNFLQYRLTPDGQQRTKITLTHRAMGLIPQEHREGVHQGWEKILSHIIKLAELKARR